MPALGFQCEPAAAEVTGDAGETPVAGDLAVEVLIDFDVDVGASDDEDSEADGEVGSVITDWSFGG